MKLPPQHTQITDPSPWIARFAPLVPAGGRVLDVACGAGRHTRFFASLGHPVDAVDREALLENIPGDVHFIRTDLEAPGAAWPFAGRQYAAAVVTNYLHRPLLPTLVEAVAPGGLLLYETFVVGNERYGKPSNPDFLLRPGELLDAVRGHLRVLAYEDLYVEMPKPAMVQRIAAKRGDSGAY